MTWLKVGATTMFKFEGAPAGAAGESPIEQ